MEELSENTYGHGGIQSPVDIRDYHYDEIGYGSVPFDWMKGYDVETELGQKIPVKNQGKSYSCGGQAKSYYDSVLEAIATGTFEERSAKFPYAQVFVQGGGSRLCDLMDISKNQGAAREVVLTSYETGMPPSEQFMERVEDITDSVRQDASRAKDSVYANVALDIDSVAQAVRDNHGTIILIRGENNGTWLSAFPKPPVNGLWGHFLYAGKAKMIDGKKFIGVLNSWGETIGEGGWQWIGEEYFTSKGVVECKTQVYNRQEVPALRHQFIFPIKLGDKSNEVKVLQQALILDGEFPEAVAPTGYYGEVTRKSVLAFQVKHNVAPMDVLTELNGENVGPATRAALNAIFYK